MANTGGRPTIYSDELVDYVCGLIATHCMGLHGLYAEYTDFPHPRTIQFWVYKYPEFLRKYLEAKSAQSHILLDNTIDIANYNTDDSLLKINRDKLIIDTYKFNATRLNRRDYGDKTQIENINPTEEKEEVRKLVEKCKKNIKKK